MEQEYTISTGWRIFYGAVAIAAIIFSLFLLPKAANGLIILPILFGTIGVATLINQFKSKLTISDDSIVRTTVFGTKELLRTHIKGFRINDKVIVIESLQAGYTKIKIRDYSSIGNLGELTKWLRENLRDLNKEEFETEKDQILANPELGYTNEERAVKFKTAARISGGYNFSAFALMFIFLFLFLDSNDIDIILLLYPLVGIVIIYLGNGLITLISKKNSAYNGLLMGLYMGVLLLVMKSFFYYHILNYHNLLIPSLVLGAIFLAPLVVKGFNKTYGSRVGQLALMIILAGGYGLGAAININCYFDGFRPQVYPAIVTAAHVSHKKTTSYHIQIDSWGQHHEIENITVTKSFYYHTSVGSTVHVMEKPGLFKMPWFYVAL
ncbi:hypothetical protein [Mucilaginibacter sp.]|uniref:hypothetical protein n=1 Tax=Mucilaginibacter sp. TaxID=1882438 RepID=UPI002ED470B3